MFTICNRTMNHVLRIWVSVYVWSPATQHLFFFSNLNSLFAQPTAASPSETRFGSWMPAMWSRCLWAWPFWRWIWTPRSLNRKSCRYTSRHVSAQVPRFLGCSFFCFDTFWFKVFFWVRWVFWNGLDWVGVDMFFTFWVGWRWWYSSSFALFHLLASSFVICRQVTLLQSWPSPGTFLGPVWPTLSTP